MLKSPLPKRSCSRGFTLLEVLIAMVILVVGISAMAALAATMLTRGRQSKYMSLAATLASEKLEDLNHWSSATTAAGTDNSDPQICVPSPDTSEGSLSADTTNSISCSGATESINYFDNVNIDVTHGSDCSTGSSGCFAETTSTTVSGTTTYYTTYHSPDGTISSPPVSSSVAPSNMTFHRRWVIEANPVIAGTTATGTRRITVLVTLLDQSIKPSVNFQMSVVRP